MNVLLLLAIFGVIFVQAKAQVFVGGGGDGGDDSEELPGGWSKVTLPSDKVVSLTKFATNNKHKGFVSWVL